jgi:hypothetical protein
MSIQLISPDVRDRFISMVVKDKTFAAINEFRNVVDEKISIAHQYGATSLTMIHWSSSSCLPYSWEALDKRMASFGLKEYHCLECNLDQLPLHPSLTGYGVVDCTGILHHSPHPIQILIALRQVVQQHLILTSVIAQEIVENDQGCYQILPSGFILIPALNQTESAILRTHWSQVTELPALEMEEVGSGVQDFASWWWLPTANALRSMCETEVNPSS